MLTKTDLRDVLNGYPTKADLRDVLKDYPTKGDLRDVLKEYPTKADLRDALKEYATKQDLDTKVDSAVTRMEVLFEQQTATMHVLFDGLEAKIDAINRRMPELEDHGRRIGSLELRTTALERRRRRRP